MEKTKELIKTLEAFYGNGHIGLASQVGYLTGVLKALELEYKSCGGWIEEHTNWLKQNKIKKK